MDIKKNELFKSGINNLEAAMDQIKFNGSLTAEDAAKIQGHINEAQSSFSALADVNPDHDGKLSTLIELTKTVDKTLKAVYSPNDCI